MCHNIFQGGAKKWHQRFFYKALKDDQSQSCRKHISKIADYAEYSVFLVNPGQYLLHRQFCLRFEVATRPDIARFTAVLDFHAARQTLDSEFSSHPWWG